MSLGYLFVCVALRVERETELSSAGSPQVPTGGLNWGHCKTFLSSSQVSQSKQREQNVEIFTESEFQIGI